LRGIAPRNFFDDFFVVFLKNIFGLERQNSWKYGFSENRSVRDRDDLLFEAVSSRSKNDVS